MLLIPRKAKQGGPVAPSAASGGSLGPVASYAHACVRACGRCVDEWPGGGGGWGFSVSSLIYQFPSKRARKRRMSVYRMLHKGERFAQLATISDSVSASNDSVAPVCEVLCVTFFWLGTLVLARRNLDPPPLFNTSPPTSRRLRALIFGTAPRRGEETCPTWPPRWPWAAVPTAAPAYRRGHPSRHSTFVWTEKAGTRCCKLLDIVLCSGCGCSSSPRKEDPTRFVRIGGGAILVGDRFGHLGEHEAARLFRKRPPPPTPPPKKKIKKHKIFSLPLWIG